MIRFFWFNLFNPVKPVLHGAIWWLRWHETQSALQLPAFLFFCQSCPGLRNCKSVFLILKIVNVADQAGEFSFFQVIHVGTDIRIDISISVRPRNTKSNKQVHLGELTQGRLVKIMCQTKTISPLLQCLWPHKLAGWWITLKNLYLLVTTSCEITRQTKTSPLPPCLWPPNLTAWWQTLSGFYPSYSTLWSRGLTRSCDKLKAYLLP